MLTLSNLNKGEGEGTATPIEPFDNPVIFRQIFDLLKTNRNQAD